ncbi:aminotransferase class V-fold PLP-dependent enzyme [Lacibacterium aquatile]|uniref:Aminotransferase class V-fold PLP-dependent enzyme n=1 Tax=Lacibacterium aquatile TaxID=1168082 RepID=A0ABW5DVT5_9PROT
MHDPRPAQGLRPIINVSGTMTGLGASIAAPQVVEAIAAFLPQFVEIDALQKQASKVIARLTGGEAGYVTASCAAGITLAIAGAMTREDLAAIERLPNTAGLKDEVVIQMGHMVHYGASIEQGIRLSGAKVVTVGTSTYAQEYQLAGAITDKTAAALFVVSHHVVEYGQIGLKEFCDVCHAKGVPVIVDAASEYDLKRFLADGADIVLYSGHKFLSGPTAGIVAGRKDLVRATYLQNLGIGRGMKVGKEGMIGVIAALTAWETRDHAGIKAKEDGYLALWQEKLNGLPGVTATVLPDPTENPLNRLKVQIDAGEARITAWDLADMVAANDPPLIVRDHEAEHGYIWLDPCNLHPGQEGLVADILVKAFTAALQRNDYQPTRVGDRQRKRFERMRTWPD